MDAILSFLSVHFLVFAVISLCTVRWSGYAPCWLRHGFLLLPYWWQLNATIVPSSAAPTIRTIRRVCLMSVSLLFGWFGEGVEMERLKKRVRDIQSNEILTGWYS